MIHLFLFDVDGVLVDAQGYLRALQDTVAYFSQAMRLGDHPPTEAEIRAFEANGLTSEWDSGAACVGALLLARLRAAPFPGLPACWPDALAALAAQPLAVPRPDYLDLARQAGQHVSGGRTPSQAALTVLRAQVKATPAVTALLDALLARTHDVLGAPVTRHFQHLTIGSHAFCQTYGPAPDFESSPYLARFDRPLLAAETRRRLERAAADGRVRLALYTLRPSLPPVEIKIDSTGYSPEAEMARALVGLDRWPLAGMGRMRWLAGQSGEGLETLVKPSPVQALAAIGAAWSGREAQAAKAALVLHGDGVLEPPLAEVSPAVVHVFEDSTVGIHAVARSIEILQRSGLAITGRYYGIAPATGPKVEAMAASRVPIYANVDTAIEAALALTGAG